MTSEERELDPVKSMRENQYNWVMNVYLPMLGQEKASALDQLHNATNWGLTLTTTAFLLAVSKQGFPDLVSLYILIVALLMCVHFYTRTLKGYINVVRWALLQRVIVEKRLQKNTIGSEDVASDLAILIDNYHVKWRLPLRRSDVFIKGLFELGYGYILGITLATTIYTVTRVAMGFAEWVGVLIALATISFELVLLRRSPYMQMSAPNENARIMR